MTKIEWAEEVWNPVTGCTKVSQGCKHCYAERMAQRLAGRFGYPKAPDQFKVKLHPDLLDKPLSWKKPRRIFVNSMSDLFHEDVPDLFIFNVFSHMAQLPRHKFLVLTKRPDRMQEFCSRIRYFTVKELPHLKAPGCSYSPMPSKYLDPLPLPNVWLGVSVEDQRTANERIPLLLQTPAAVRFVSCEPLLGPVDLAKAVGEPNDDDWDVVNLIDIDDSEPEELIEECEAECDWINYGNDLVQNPEWREWNTWRHWRARLAKVNRLIDWVIIGGESGPGARPMELSWATDLVKILRPETKVFVKQLGGFPDKRNRIEEWPKELRIREYPTI